MNLATTSFYHAETMSVFFAFFLISGFCSLVYEIVWLRLAMAQFGVTTPQVAIVLSVFMAGLALGSWLVGRLAPRLAARAGWAPVRAYALAELIIAISGLTVPAELEWGRSLLERLGPVVFWGSAGYYLASGLWIALTLLPFCICMGATFPLAMAAIRSYDRAGSDRSFSYLYFANVGGATTGTVASAFFMIELLGFRGTLRATAALNLILAISAFALSLAHGRRSFTPGPALAREAPEACRPAAGGAALALLFLTGLTSMAMEVVWIRQFTPYLGTVIYAFAVVLALYLTATFLGSSAYRIWSRSSGPGRIAASSGAWLAVGLAGLMPLAAADPRFSAVGQPAIAALPLGVVRLMLGIMPFCALVGFLTPMLVDRWSGGDPDRAGRAYAINVLGSILGPLLAGFGLLPLVGERWALVVLAAPLFIVGGLPAAPARPPAAAPAMPPGWLRSAAAFVTLLALIAGPLIVFTRDFETVFPGRVVLRDNTATVIAVSEGGHKRLLVNGIGMTVLTHITKMMSHLPMASLTAPPRSSLVVCFGMGTSFRSLLSWGVSATAVELVPSVPLLFGYYHRDATTLLASPVARVVIDDGRRFLERTTELYDVITIDPPPPIETAGSSLLYSREFYAVVQKRLRPGGILQQWLPGAEPFLVASVARALADTFPHVRAFRYREGWGIHFLASLRPMPPASSSELAARLPPGAAADLVEWGPASTPAEQFRMTLAVEVPVTSLIAIAPRAPALRDDRPVNEYFFLRRLFRKAPA